MEFSNTQVAAMLREVAAVYAVKKKGNIFQIRAYEAAAGAIEQSTVEIKDLWEEGKLDKIPGIGKSLREHLDELFRTGKVKYWEKIKEGLPKIFFELLNIPGIGPKTALKLVELGVKNREDLKRGIVSGKLVERGFSEKIAMRILAGIKEASLVRTGRMLLPYVFTQAEKILSYLKKNPKIETADALGSLRRMVVTVGDLDFAVASKHPRGVVEYIVSMPGVARVVEKGVAKVTLVLTSGLHADFRIINPDVYGSLLQYFTGSKLHNIHLRNIALDKGLSLSEYGVKEVKSGKIKKSGTEKEFYALLGMDVPPPEIREDTGEIEAALAHKLPQLVELEDIKGDLHIHSNFPIEPSHDLGADSIKDLVKKAKELGYSYIGLSDHQPSVGNHTENEIIAIMTKRSKLIGKIKSSENFPVLNLLEGDISSSGDVLIPERGLKMLDFVIAGVHSAHRQPKEQMTKRILKALENPYVKVLTHPTGRLLNERQSYEVEWDEVFQFCAKNNKALEINSWPNRLDLTDALIRGAKSFGVKFLINTDSHEKSQMENMRFGVAVARKGWATKEDIINTWDWTRFCKWFNISL